MSEAKKTQGSVLWPMIKLGLILALYAAASCTVLAVVNSKTSQVIKQNQIAKANRAMKAVFESAESFEPLTDFAAASDPAVTVNAVYLAKDGSEVLGAVAQVTGPTYDHSTIIAGVDKDGIVTGLQFLENTDTPGFGQKASDPTFKLANGLTFYEQFKGKAVKDGFEAGKTFDAISGATITSKGTAALVTAAAEACTKAYTEALHE